MKITSFDDLVEAILARKVAFVLTFFVIFLITYAVLAWLDFLPEPVSATNEVEAVGITVSATSAVNALVSNIVSATKPEVVEPMVAFDRPIMPESITIEKLNRTIDVINPTSRTIEDLDAALLYGVVRHPDSATLDQTGTVFIFGHSSYLPTVRNRNFQAFNGLQTLRFGDSISVHADGVEYVYRVDRVYRANASELVVPIAGTTKKLVLATCNSFGAVDDRFIVEADLVEAIPILARS